MSDRLSVCPSITPTLLHASPSDFTRIFIPTPGRFSHAFRSSFPFLISAVTLKLIQMTLPLFQSPLSRSRRFITPPFHCSNSECPKLSGWCAGFIGCGIEPRLSNLVFFLTLRPGRRRVAFTSLLNVEIPVKNMLNLDKQVPKKEQ